GRGVVVVGRVPGPTGRCRRRVEGLLGRPPALPRRTRRPILLGRSAVGGVSGEHLGDADTALGVQRSTPSPLGFLTVTPGAFSPFRRLRTEPGSVAVVRHARSLRSKIP